MKTLKQISFFIVTMACLSAWAGKEGHGSDSITFSSGANEILDKLECTIPFEPSDLPEFDLVKNQLQLLSEKLPVTGRYLDGIFHGAGPLWCWVETPLVKIDDVGSSPVRISLNWDKKQLGENTGLFVLIHKPTFDTLPDPTQKGEQPSKSLTLSHEAMWSAVEDTCAQTMDGNTIRTLSNIVMHPSIRRRNPKNLIEMLSGLLGKSPACLASKFTQALRQDLSNLTQLAPIDPQNPPVSGFLGVFASTEDTARDTALAVCNSTLGRMSQSQRHRHIEDRKIGVSDVSVGPSRTDLVPDGYEIYRVERRSVTQLLHFESVYENLYCSIKSCEAFDLGTYQCTAIFGFSQEVQGPFTRPDVYDRVIKKDIEPAAPPEAPMRTPGVTTLG